MKCHQKTRVDPGPTLYLLGSDYLQVKMIVATVQAWDPRNMPTRPQSLKTLLRE